MNERAPMDSAAASALDAASLDAGAAAPRGGAAMAPPPWST